MGWLFMSRGGMAPFATPKAYLDNQCTYPPDPEKGRETGPFLLRYAERHPIRTAAMTDALPAYAELQCRSNFSFLRGASHPEELVATDTWMCLFLTNKLMCRWMAHVGSSCRCEFLKPRVFADKPRWHCFLSRVKQSLK